MNEADWWSATGPSTWPHPLVNWLFYAGASDRKLRLACVALVQPVEQYARGAPFPYLLRVIERFADGNEDEDRVRRAFDSVGSWQHDRHQNLVATEGHPTFEEEVEDHVQTAILCAGSAFRGREWHQARKNYSYPCFVVEHMLTATGALGQRDAAERTLIHLLHDIFGPLPFRDVVIAADRLTSDVTALARGIYDDKAFDRMPILADALQDAGCDNDEILSHCRAANWKHVRGCWVLDLLLGRPWRELV
jgi:hypothetical protein